MARHVYSSPYTLTLSPGDGAVLTLLQKDGTPYNLAQWSVRAQIKTSLGVLASEFTVTVLDAAKGIVRLSLPNPGQAGALAAGRYVYNVLLWQGANEDRLQASVLRILEAVTVRP